MKDLRVEDDELLVSYDVSALFTSIPLAQVLEAVKSVLETDDSWKCCTYLNSNQVLKRLEFCLSTTYFTFCSEFYKQLFGYAMGCACSPVIADLFMERYEQQALSSATNPLKIWLGYMDDTFVILLKYQLDDFTSHFSMIKQIDSNIKSTTEPEKDGIITLLDTEISRLPDGSLKLKVCRKPTHTDQYLNFDSHHPLDHKLSVSRTLFHRADTTVITQADFQQEINHIKGALASCGYKKWTFKAATKKSVATGAKNTSSTGRNPFVVLPNHRIPDFVINKLILCYKKIHVSHFL